MKTIMTKRGFIKISVYFGNRKSLLMMIFLKAAAYTFELFVAIYKSSLILRAH